MTESTIGDYYDRIDERRRQAEQALRMAEDKYFQTEDYDDYFAMLRAREAVIDAGNTGD